MVNNAFYRQLLDNLNTAVAVIDHGLILTFINSTAEDLFATSRERILDQPLSSLFHDSASPAQELQQALKESARFTKREVNWTLANGQQLTVDFSVSPYNENQLILEIQPLDRLLRISRGETHLSTQETTRSLIRGLAHEIKNPLGGIRGAAQLLARELPDPNFEEFTQIIIGETDRLRNLVDKMLGPHNPPQSSPVNIHEVLERAGTIIAVESGDTITITRDYDPSIPELKGDKEQLIQALLNITRNAMQAITESGQTDGKITLRSRVQRQFTIGRKHYPLACKISIIDNGPGIPAHMLNSIFYPMISNRANGTGLGLAITQQLINQHHGLVECNSQPQHTEFNLYLPVDYDHAKD